MIKAIYAIVDNVKHKRYLNSALAVSGPHLLARFFSIQNKSQFDMKHSFNSNKRKLYKLKNTVSEFIEKYKNIINIHIVRSDSDTNLSYYMDFIKDQFIKYDVENLSIKKI